ncbi:electron transfer flavoprotein alpha subunit [Psychromicrobium silvestre]|uniref:Electron transfer flavoprotein alpha subunit n=1 Tax=Psychromicrobium silvestre TaxID=1645614 RepID=A0A7Y9LSW7_9MICC|nr:electron transfer flavoprotein subunit alpha/FixB family protein [Psychromicrobium silvestre]NYE94988.1 electron transfer flavoprotein alpha subunit [Psychromicrobium silvestre]
MSSVVVFVDLAHPAPAANPGVLSKASRELLTLARSAGEPVAAVAGPVAESLLTELASYGASRVLHSEQSELSEYSVVPKAEFLATVAREVSARAVLTENGAEAKEIAARAALLLEAGVISDAVGLDPELGAQKSVLAGSYLVSATVSSPVAVIAVKGNSVEASPASAPADAQLQPVTVEFSAAARGTKVVQRAERTVSIRPELTEARIVVSGGRGVDGDFGPVEALADALGAAVGASRAATDAGWIDHAFQVGQTGKTVSPQLYISVGISGAIQQKAGMQTSKLIVAVNKDPESPIFEIADLGIVGDLFKVLPQAVEEINRRRG